MLMLFFAAIIAMIMPLLGLMISLIGTVTISFLGIIFPALMDTYVHYPKPKKLKIIKDIVITAFGLCGFFSGLYVSLMDLIETFSKMYGSD